MIALAEKPFSPSVPVAPRLLARPPEGLLHVALGARAERVEARRRCARAPDLDEQVVERRARRRRSAVPLPYGLNSTIVGRGASGASPVSVAAQRRCRRRS